MNQILTIIMIVGAIIGGVDRILGNRLGYGAKFEEGFLFLGPTALSMAGMICLTPILSKILGTVVVPIYHWIGADPGMFGSFLAIDMGGFQLARELAVDPHIGAYAGIVVSSIFGCTIVFTIPVGMGMIAKSDQRYFAKGIMIGLIAMPIALTVGGLLCGLSVLECLHQNLPVFILALLLLLGLWHIPEHMIRGFYIFSGLIRFVVTIGLLLGVINHLCGFTLIKGIAPITEAMSVVSSIGIVMLGSLPAAECLQRILKRPFCLLGRRFCMNSTGMTGLLVGAVSVIPAISMFKDMDERAKVANAAFLVSAASLFAAHTGFTLSTQPEFLGALIGAKISGGVVAFLLVHVIYTRKNKSHHASNI